MKAQLLILVCLVVTIVSGCSTSTPKSSPAAIQALTETPTPTSAIAAPPKTAGLYHTVRWGETLFSIGRYYGVSPYVLCAMNDCGSSNAIFAGKTLYIPVDLAVAHSEDSARAGTELVALPGHQPEQTFAYRRFLGIPPDFLPEARSLVYYKVGELRIEGPDTMMVGETAVFSVTLSPDSNLVGDMDSNSFTPVVSDSIRFSRVLYARLDGIDFEINPPRDNPQPRIVSAGNKTCWTWQVRATRLGQQQPLTARVFAAAQGMLEESTEPMVMLVPDETKYIQTSQPFLERMFSNQLVQNIVVALIGSSVVASVLVYILDRRTDDRLRKLEKVQEKLQHTVLQTRLQTLRNAHQSLQSAPESVGRSHALSRVTRELQDVEQQLEERRADR